LHMVQLDEQTDRPSTLLSGGQQQRVALAGPSPSTPGCCSWTSP
jgi:ABC-type polar amino acid transport system ATPase subunit